MGLVDEDGLDELRALAHDLAEDDGLLEEEHLELFELFLAQFSAAVELAVQQQFPLRCYFTLNE